jgi:hypothetical protein
LFGGDIQLDNRNAVNDKTEAMPYLFRDPTEVYRAQDAFSLTTEQREEFGGREYRAVKQLLLPLLAYILIWQVLGSIALGSWMQNNLSSEQASLVGAVQPWWLGILPEYQPSTTWVCLWLTLA